MGTSVYVKDGNKLLLKRMIMSIAMIDYDQGKLKNQVSWIIKTMKTVFGIKNTFQSNHLSSKSTAEGQAVLRASKLQVFYHAWC